MTDGSTWESPGRSDDNVMSDEELEGVVGGAAEFYDNPAGAYLASDFGPAPSESDLELTAENIGNKVADS